MKLLTVDTNVLRDILEPQRSGHSTAVRLLELHKAGRCNIKVTTRLDVDVPDGPVRADIDALEIVQFGTVFRIGSSRLAETPEHGDFLAKDDQVADARRLLDTIFPGASPDSPKHRNRLADVDHLLGHKHSGRDMFVTGEKAILEHREWLAKEIGIIVENPKAAVEAVQAF